MTITEVNQDLFTVSSDYYFAHCISSDYGMGKGIVVEFNKRFNLKAKVKSVGKHVYPDCILIGNVFNLVTKNTVWDKPTHNTIKESLFLMKNMCNELDINKIAMPKIGCGLDRQKWSDVKRIIEEVFENTDVEILVCSL